jgi:ParB-like chromosome segregation protein Spo0J
MHPAIEMLAVEDLQPYSRNSRTHSDAQVAQLVASIKKFGFTNPVLVDAKNSIVAGHGRVTAAKQMGLTSLPCLRLAHLSEEEVRAYVIADNQLALTSDWDMDALRGEMSFLADAGFGLDVIGFADQFQAELLAGRTKDNGRDPDAAPDLGPVAFARAGDIWVCGPHRVACGDATDSGVWAGLMGGGGRRMSPGAIRRTTLLTRVAPARSKTTTWPPTSSCCCCRACSDAWPR